jgi:hypothetical protein
LLPSESLPHLHAFWQRTLDVRPKASVEIPFMFTPAGLTRHSCFLHVRSITTSRYQVCCRGREGLRGGRSSIFMVRRRSWG